VSYLPSTFDVDVDVVDEVVIMSSMAGTANRCTGVGSLHPNDDTTVRRDGDSPSESKPPDNDDEEEEDEDERSRISPERSSSSFDDEDASSAW
jgi:hypothetical protein